MTILLYAALFILLALCFVMWSLMAISGRCSREEELSQKLADALESDLFGAPEGAQR